MAVISEVKCSRCDRKYSGFRSRCPYCGARRSKRGKHADETENAKAKLIIGVVLLVVLIAAAMVLIFSSLPDQTDPDAGNSPGVSEPATPSYTDNQNVTSVPGASDDVSASASPSESPSPSIDPNVKVASVTITYGGAKREDVTMNIGESLNFSFVTAPVTTDKVPIWDSSDNNVFVVTGGHVTAMGKGTANLTVTVDGVEGKCIIRVKGG
jgi:predicted  nucleic acid-binding Zn-ribbon protein